VITQNGTCYWETDFTSSLRKARHYRIRPYTPKHNGKVERYNRILAEELLYSREYASEADPRTAVEVWCLSICQAAVRDSLDAARMVRFSSASMIRHRCVARWRLSARAADRGDFPSAIFLS
jgi:transposase InsO family protein